MNDAWDLSGRDVVPDLVAAGKPADVGAAALYAMLLNDNKPFVAPYDELRKNLQIRSKAVLPELQESSNERLRTYKTMFRGLGLIYDEDQRLHATDAGKALLDLLQQQYQSVDDYARGLAIGTRPRLMRLVAPVLARYQLASPITSARYPDGTDVRPLLAIWRVMRALDDKLHWEELGRALTPCLVEAQLPDVIEAIRTARQTEGYDPSDRALITATLGPRRPDNGPAQSDRLDTWFSRAAFKNLLLEPRDRPDGYRYLASDALPVIDGLLSDPPAFNSTSDPGAYVRWLGASAVQAAEPGAADDDPHVRRVVDRARRFGHRQIIALAGPAGTGKTRAAHAAALILADGDPTRVTTVQFHAAVTYEEFVGGLAPVGATFEPVAGTLVEVNDRAIGDPTRTHVLVVDELSRADVANVLGELLTYIEYRGRVFRLPALNRDVSIAANLIVLATLNPADRSVIGMDDALVRRLRQVPVPRSAAALRRILLAGGATGALTDQVCAWFDALPEDCPFGHGLFVGVRDESDLRDLWAEELRYFLRRGGLPVYPDPRSIESGYVWKDISEDWTPASGGPAAPPGDEAEAEAEPAGADGTAPSDGAP